MRKTYYSGIKHATSHKKNIYTIVCTVVALLLIAFIIWAGATYGQYSDQGKDAIKKSEDLKSQIEKKNEEITSLKKDISDYKNQLKQEKDKVQMLLDTGATLPEKTENNNEKSSTKKTTSTKKNTTNKATTEQTQTPQEQAPAEQTPPTAEQPTAPAESAPTTPNADMGAATPAQ